MHKVIKCKICLKDIEFKQSTRAYRSSHEKIWVSDQGKCFENAWFCLDCWKEVIKPTPTITLKPNTYVLGEGVYRKKQV